MAKKDKNNRIILTAGGSGGHLYPAVAVAEALEQKGCQVLFLISDKEIDSKILISKGYNNFYKQKSTPFAGLGLFRKVTSILKVFQNILSVWRFIKKGDIVISFGGYATVAPSSVAFIKRCDLYLHEQNIVMGKSNKFFSKFAKTNFLSYDSNDRFKNSVVVGNLIRKDFDNITVKERLGKQIFICGGSQGSRFINKIIVKSIDKLIEKGYFVYHQTGIALYDEVLNEYGDSIERYKDSLKVVAYIEDMKETLIDSDVVISRAGSGAIHEIMYSHRPAVYIPLKSSANNHQYFNAEFVQSQGIGYLIQEDEIGTEILVDKIDGIYRDYEAIKENLNKINYIDGAEKIVSHILGKKND